MNCTVTARPMSFFSGCRIWKSPSYWLLYPSPGSTSRLPPPKVRPSFSRSFSSTLGRPSGKALALPLFGVFDHLIACERRHLRGRGAANGQQQKGCKISIHAHYFIAPVLVGEGGHSRQFDAREEFERCAAAGRNVRDPVGNAGTLDGLFGIAASYHRNRARFRHGFCECDRALIERRLFENAHRAVPDHRLRAADDRLRKPQLSSADVDRHLVGRNFLTVWFSAPALNSDATT